MNDPITSANNLLALCLRGLPPDQEIQVGTIAADVDAVCNALLYREKDWPINVTPPDEDILRILTTMCLVRQGYDVGANRPTYRFTGLMQYLIDRFNIKAAKE